MPGDKQWRQDIIDFAGAPGGWPRHKVEASCHRDVKPASRGTNPERLAGIHEEKEEQALNLYAREIRECQLAELRRYTCSVIPEAACCLLLVFLKEGSILHLEERMV
jgi:hypothetical protein